MKHMSRRADADPSYARAQTEIKRRGDAGPGNPDRGEVFDARLECEEDGHQRVRIMRETAVRRRPL